MAKFRVLEGEHHELNPEYRSNDPFDVKRRTKYVKGDIIESDKELDKVFVNKFSRVNPHEFAETIDPAIRTPLVNELISHGGWREDDRSFLMFLPTDGFNRVYTNSVKPKGSLLQGEPGAEKPVSTLPGAQGHESGSGEKPGAKKGPLGEEVTDEFPAATAAGLKVWRNSAGKFQVTKVANNKKPVNMEAFNSPPEVTTWLETEFASE